MSSQSSVDRFSTVADFELLAGGRSYRVGQVAPEFLLLHTASEIAPGPAVLLIRVEGKESRKEIVLPTGATTQSRRVPILEAPR